MGYSAAERSIVDIGEFEERLRGPAPRSPGDPLAELARLVSAEKPPHTLDAVFARPTVANAPAAEPDFGFGDLRGAIGSDGAYAPPGDSASQDQFDGPASAEEWPAAQGPTAGAPPRSKRPLYATAAVILVGLVGIGSTFAFKGHRGGTAGEVVEVKAAPGPTKVQAQTADSGKTAVDSTILDRGAPAQAVSRVVDRQEKPVEIKDAIRMPKPLATAGSTQMANLMAAVSGESGGTAVAEPRKVKTVSVRPDGTIVGAPTVANAPAAANAADTAPKSATPKAAARVATTPKPAADKPEATTKPVVAKTETTPKAAPVRPTAKPSPARADADDDTPPTATTAPRASGGGGFAVQLAAPGSEAEAKSAASKLGQKYADALGGSRLTFQKADDKAVYRVRTAGMSREAAVAACEKVKAAGGSCFVAKN